MNCKLCGKEITDENKSSEHIIHNAIGGILESSSIYCKNCNAKYGTDQDKAFTNIFIPFVESLKIRKGRSSKGSKYYGVMYDPEGNIYRVEYQAGKIRHIKDSEGKYLGNKPRSDMTFGGYEFNMDNKALKAGLAKIAFNYAVYSGILTCNMNTLFDYVNKSLLEKPIVLPFIPLTSFDAIMESKEPERLFHALRIFNIGSYLFVYIELFSTFQFYVLVSDEYGEYDEFGESDIDQYYCNYIDKNDMPDEKTLEYLTPFSPKDAHIILNQYNLCLEEIEETVRRKLDKLKYDEETQLSEDSDENAGHKDTYQESEELKEPKDPKQTEQPNYNNATFWKLLCEEIGKRAYETLRKQSYERNYEEVVNSCYNRAGFLENAMNMMNSMPCSVNPLLELYQSCQFYTDYEDDCVNISVYKRILPDRKGYPESICKLLLRKDVNASVYTKYKFQMLVNRMKTISSEDNISN